MSNLPNTLRMYAEDMHSAFGHGYCSEAMSRAADLLEAQVGTITALNIALGGKDSTSTENLVDSHEIDIADVGLITMCRKLMAENFELEAERDQLAAQNEAMRESVELYFKQYPHMMKGYILDALNLPNLAAEVLKRRDAKVLREAADRFEAVDPHPKHWDWLRRMANEIDGKEAT